MSSLTQPDDAEKPSTNLTALALRADEDQLRLFLRTVFKHCTDLKGWVSLRAFEHEDAGAAIINRWVPFGSGLVPAAIETASAVANRPFKQRAVFSPPVAIFGDMTNERGKRIASEANVIACPVIAVELDERPTESLKALTAVLGPPTLVIVSGGLWAAPGGTTETRLHAYWRMRIPATSLEDRAALRRARSLASRLVGADATAVPLNHPMRWPGSWHTKAAEPRLCRIVEGEFQRDVELPWALHALEMAVTDAGLAAGDDRARGLAERTGFKTARAWSAEELANAAKLIPNSDLTWDRWNRIGMAFYDASHASVDGLDAFHAWSEKDDRYDADTVDARWSHWHSSPPSDLSAGTLLHEVRKAEPNYRAPLDVVALLWEPPTVSGPADIFGHEDPGELGSPPAGSLPSALERWAASEARRKGVPVSFAAISAVTAAAAAVGGSLRLQARLLDTEWTEPAGFFTTIVADPGSAKSAIIKAAMQPLNDLNKEFMRDWKPRKAAWDAAVKPFRQNRKGAVDPGPEPICKRVTFDNATAEKLVRMLSENPRGMVCTPDELASALGSFGAYKRNGEGDRAQMLRTFDGDDVVVDRVGGGTISAENALMSLIAGTQPDKLRTLTKDLGVDGLLQRFIFVLHDGKDRRGVDEAPDAETSADYRRIIQGLAKADYLYPSGSQNDCGGFHGSRRCRRADPHVEEPAGVQHCTGWSPREVGQTHSTACSHVPLRRRVRSTWLRRSFDTVDAPHCAAGGCLLLLPRPAQPGILQNVHECA
jgi:hypothetical protein